MHEICKLFPEIDPVTAKGYSPRPADAAQLRGADPVTEMGGLTMGWIGLRDTHDGWFRPDPRLSETGSDRVLHRGSLVIETRVSAEVRPQTLLAFRRTWPMSWRFSMQALPQGGIVLVDAQGDDICHATLPFTSDGRLDILRLTYSWDTAEGGRV